MIKVGVLGAKGRMGSQVCSTVESADDLELAARVDIGDSLESLAGVDVVVDFTQPAAVMDNLRWCIGRGLAAVVGTSGFGDDRLAQVSEWLAAQPGSRVCEISRSPSFRNGGANGRLRTERLSIRCIIACMPFGRRATST